MAAIMAAGFCFPNNSDTLIRVNLELAPVSQLVRQVDAMEVFWPEGRNHYQFPHYLHNRFFFVFDGLLGVWIYVLLGQFVSHGVFFVGWCIHWNHLCIDFFTFIQICVLLLYIAFAYSWIYSYIPSSSLPSSFNHMIMNKTWNSLF